MIIGQQPSVSLQELLKFSDEERSRIRELFYQRGLRSEVAQEAQELRALTKAIREQLDAVSNAMSNTITEQANSIRDLQIQVQLISDREKRLRQLWPVRFLQVWSDQGLRGIAQEAIRKLRQGFALPPKLAETQLTGSAPEEPTTPLEVKPH